MLHPHNTLGQKIPISPHHPAGRDAGGFTLVEIMVVIALMALMLVFSFPRLSGFFAINHRNKMIRWMIVQRTVLRTRAVAEQVPYALRVDIDNNRILPMPMMMPQAGAPSPDDGAVPETVKPSSGRKALNPFVCGSDLDITGVLFPEGEEITDQAVDILFSEKGYCDHAIIHVREGDSRFSLYIEPFLTRVTVYDGYIKFGQRWEEGI